LLSGDAASLDLGVEVRVLVRPLYNKVDYSGLTRGVTFLIKEGAQTVGQGMVLQTSSN
jgi:translation elongation factor EF-Tu-like GTPase